MISLKPLVLVFLGLLSHLTIGTAISARDTDTFPAKAASCPDSDGQLIVDVASNSAFYIQCSTDRPGGDLLTEWASSIEECVAKCSSTPGCVAASFSIGSPGPCYLKSSLGFPTLNGGIVTVFKNGGNSGLVCPSGENKKLTINADTYHTVKCGWARRPEPEGFAVTVLSTSFEECLKSCELQRYFGCNYATFYPGQDLIPGQSVPAPGGKCVFSRKISVAEGPEDQNAWWGVRNSICPNRDGNKVRSGGASSSAPGRNYEIKCNSDWLQNDLPEEPRETDTLISCLNECDRRAPHCFGVTFRVAYPKGLCFFKGGAAGVIVPQQPGVIRGKLAA